MTPITPWVERSFNFNFTTGLFPVIFSRLEGSIFRLFNILTNADDKQCSNSEYGWTVKQHLGHLTDLEDLWWRRLDDFLQNKKVLSAADMTNKKTEEGDHNDKPIDTLLADFTRERQKMLEMVYGYDEELLLRTALHPRLNIPMRLIDSLYFVAEHDDHHIAIISARLRKPVG
jgi:uncharacterized damage-inducible protein DinB